MAWSQRALINFAMAVAAVLLLLPDWVAVYPTNPNLNVDMGRHWIWADPEPPSGFDAMLGVWWWLAWPAIIIGAAAAFYWLAQIGSVPGKLVLRRPLRRS